MSTKTRTEYPVTHSSREDFVVTIDDTVTPTLITLQLDETGMYTTPYYEGTTADLTTITPCGITDNAVYTDVDMHDFTYIVPNMFWVGTTPRDQVDQKRFMWSTNRDLLCGHGKLLGMDNTDTTKDDYAFFTWGSGAKYCGIDTAYIRSYDGVPLDLCSFPIPHPPMRGFVGVQRLFTGPSVFSYQVRDQGGSPPMEIVNQITNVPANSLTFIICYTNLDDTKKITLLKSNSSRPLIPEVAIPWDWWTGATP